jgi:hypothetical protein
MKEDFKILYRLNSLDKIVFVNDEWNRFALENDAPEMIAKEILDRSLWDFVSGDTIKNLYQIMLRKVRAGNEFSSNFRCDAPALRRRFQITVSLMENGDVQFETSVIGIEKRVQQDIFDRNAQRSDKLIIICSWCNKFEIEENSWKEIEEAAEKLKLFELEGLPQISHGMCSDCYQSLSQRF